MDVLDVWTEVLGWKKRVSPIEMLIVDCSLQAAKKERVALGGCRPIFLDMVVEL